MTPFTPDPVIYNEEDIAAVQTELGKRGLSHVTPIQIERFMTVDHRGLTWVNNSQNTVQLLSVLAAFNDEPSEIFIQIIEPFGSTYEKSLGIESIAFLDSLFVEAGQRIIIYSDNYIANARLVFTEVYRSKSTDNPINTLNTVEKGQAFKTTPGDSIDIAALTFMEGSSAGNLTTLYGDTALTIFKRVGTAYKTPTNFIRVDDDHFIFTFSKKVHIHKIDLYVSKVPCFVLTAMKEAVSWRVLKAPGNYNADVIADIRKLELTEIGAYEIEAQTSCKLLNFNSEGGGILIVKEITAASGLA